MTERETGLDWTLTEESNCRPGWSLLFSLSANTAQFVRKGENAGKGEHHLQMSFFEKEKGERQRGQRHLVL